MHKIKVQGNFSAAHNLRGYQGRCEKLHGHNWKVEAEVASGQLNKLAMVCDFHEIKQKLGTVLAELDHSHLNEFSLFKKTNPTSEKIAQLIYVRLKKLIKDKDISLRSIAVWETDSSCAIYSEDE